MKLAWRAGGALVLQAALWNQGAHAAGKGGEHDDLLYDEIARRWLERNEVQAPASGSDRGWPELLEQRFAHLALGVFDVFLPTAALGDERALKDVSAALLALLDAQQGLADWVAGATPAKRRDDPVAKWLRTLAPKPFAGRSAAGADLAELAAAEELVRVALEELRSAQRRGTPFGVERELPGVRLAIFPRRSEFVEFTCVVGLLDPRAKPSAWSAGLHTWLEYEAGDTRFLALEYCASAERHQDREEGDPARGVSVAERNPSALAQLVTQVASRSLFARVFPGGLDPSLASGLANALVIDLHGELDTRIDGDVRARSSEGSSTFVPGGNPNGGVLPATSAESRWRGTNGKDHFVGILSQVQKRSGKKGSTRPERLARFELQSDDGSRNELACAPFLGPDAVRPSADVFPDYLELVRCYGVAFLHWLRLEGAGKPAESRARFGELLRAFGRGAKAEDLPRVLQELYGQPLSAASADELFDEPTLEGRFLVWLSKQG